MQNRDRNIYAAISALIIIVIIVSVSFSGCKGAPPEKPAPNVTFDFPVEQEVIERDEYSGRLESPQIANVAARINGTITEVPFKEGSIVKQGDLLFVIDDRPFKAELGSKEAAVAKAEALLLKASSRMTRYERVRSSGAVSADDFDQATADLKQAQSELMSAKADAEIARLNLEWTRVKAPIDGQVSRKLVTEGNNVIGGSGQMTQLTTITSIDPLYAYVSVPEDKFRRYENINSHLTQTTSTNLPCEFILEDSKDYRKDCSIDFVDSKINTSTGTVQLRGVIPNSSGALKSGMFVRMRIPYGDQYKALLIPDIAVGADQSTRFVLVINKDSIVESRPVILGSQFGNMRVIKEGIKLEDRVIVAGMQAARPGIKVNSTYAKATPTPASAPSEVKK